MDFYARLVASKYEVKLANLSFMLVKYVLWFTTYVNYVSSVIIYLYTGA